MPQPIDFQGELGRTTAAEKIQQLADRLSLAAQLKMADAIQRERVDMETQVQQTHAQSEQVEREKRRRNPYLSRKRRPEDSEDQQAGANADVSPQKIIVNPDEGQQLDITI